jgi:hypothetical protein
MDGGSAAFRRMKLVAEVEGADAELGDHHLMSRTAA